MASQFAYTLTFSRYLLTVGFSADARLDFKSRSVANGKAWKQVFAKEMEGEWDSHEKAMGTGSALTKSRKAAAMNKMTSEVNGPHSIVYSSDSQPS